MKELTVTMFLSTLDFNQVNLSLLQTEFRSSYTFKLLYIYFFLQISRFNVLVLKYQFMVLSDYTFSP